MHPLANRIQRANSLLAPYAVPHEGVKGRVAAEEPDATRFPFQRDRGRIIHSRTFRRLKGKTQVFVSGEGDHYRTRLTHTMEVAQISRDMARTLELNEDLAECIALAHDLGHPPFGHAGEAALNEWMQQHNQVFEHNVQSLRIVSMLEPHSKRIPGLNLNQEVLDGLRKHDDIPHSLEAQLVNLADEIAYTAHDCDDGIRAKLFGVDDVITTTLGSNASVRAADRKTPLRGSIVHLLVSDVYTATERQLQAQNITSLQAVYEHPEPLVCFSTNMREQLQELRRFLWKHLYEHPDVLRPTREGKKMVLALCESLHAQPPAKVERLQAETESDVVIAVKDYVAGMTDAYARNLAAKAS